MPFPPKNGPARFLFLVFSLIFALIAAVLFFRYLFSALLPFLIAFLVALLLRRPTLALSKKTRLPQKLVASLLAVLFACALLFGLGWLVQTLILELGDFAGAVVSGENPLLGNIKALLLSLSEMLEKLPLPLAENSEPLKKTLSDALMDVLKNTATALGTRLPAIVGTLASAIPEILIFGMVTVLSSVYFCADYEKIMSFMRSHLPQRAKNILGKLKHITEKVLAGVLRSYALLFLITFAELFLGFVLLKEPYAFLLAILTALVDSLPILGTGTVLVPMALYRFFIGDRGAAIGLCILYLVVTAVRQILEPRLLGAGTGIHPLFMLISMYLGLRLFGIFGMILLPVLAVMLKNAYTGFKNTSEVI